jgi:hypothetical protein
MDEEKCRQLNKEISLRIQNTFKSFAKKDSVLQSIDSNQEEFNLLKDAIRFKQNKAESKETKNMNEFKSFISHKTEREEIPVAINQNAENLSQNNQNFIEEEYNKLMTIGKDHPLSVFHEFCQKFKYNPQITTTQTTEPSFQTTIILEGKFKSEATASNKALSRSKHLFKFRKRFRIAY